MIHSYYSVLISAEIFTIKLQESLILSHKYFLHHCAILCSCRHWQKITESSGSKCSTQCSWDYHSIPPYILSNTTKSDDQECGPSKWIIKEIHTFLWETHRAYHRIPSVPTNLNISRCLSFMSRHCPHSTSNIFPSVLEIKFVITKILHILFLSLDVLLTCLH